MHGEIRNRIEEMLPDTGVGAILRDATLRAIKRKDLIIDEGRDESGHRRPRKRTPLWVYTTVHLTDEQHAELVAAARKKALSLSTLMLESVLFELGIKPPPASKTGGWTRGKRRSRPPIEK
jgi:hypothetical protein